MKSSKKRSATERHGDMLFSSVHLKYERKTKVV